MGEKRLLTKSEIDRINGAIDKCGCECHTYSVMHMVACCNFCYSKRVSEGSTTTYTVEEINTLVGDQQCTS